MFQNCFSATCMVILLFLLPNGQPLQAQTESPQSITIKGQVLDEYARPLPGASITTKAGPDKIITDADGRFQVSAAMNSILVVSHPLFDVQVITIRSDKELLLKLAERTLRPVSGLPTDSTSLGMTDLLYESKSSDKIISSVGTVYGNQLRTTPASLYLYSLPGRLPGLNVNQTSGFYSAQMNGLTDLDIFVGNIPKNASGIGPTDNTEFNVQLRGHAGSLGQAPIAIIDGVQREIYSIDPESIESVSILKDALSTILLGQNSSRGALLVTTKVPQAGAPHLSFTAETGTQTSLGLQTPLQSYQYAYLLNEALLNEGKSAAYTGADFNAYRNGTDPINHPNVDWYNTILAKNSMLTRYNLNVNGGGSTARYIVSLNYTDQDGAFKTNPSNSYNTNNNLKRYLINSKIEVDVNKNFGLGLQLFGRLQQGNQPGAGSSTILRSLLSTPNNAYAVLNPDGSYGGNVNYQNNLLSMVENSGYLSDNAKDVMANLDLKYKFDNWVPGLWFKAKGNVSVQSSSIINRSKQSPIYALLISSTGDSTYNRFGSTNNQVNAFTATSWARYIFAQASLGYDKQIGDQSIGAMILFDKKTTLLNYDIPSALTNIAGKVNYDYKGKYLVEAAVNYSGYNRFKPGNQFGLFYAGGLGWNIAKENFISDNVSWINQLKLRATYGRTGNANVDNYGYYIYRSYFTDVAGTYGIGSNYTNSIGLAESGTPGSQTLANVAATWEKADKFDVGLDLSVMDNHLQLTVDYYYERYFDVLQTRGKSIELIGQRYPVENIGINRYSGAEGTLTYQNNIRDFNYFITANASVQASRVLFMDEQYQDYSWNKHTGRPVQQRFGLLADGFIQTIAEAVSVPTTTGYAPHVGDYKYQDLNGDGVINQFDLAPIGKEKPLIYFGLNAGVSYKGFAISALIQGVQNRELYIDNLYTEAGFLSQNNGFSQAYEEILGRWTPENPTLSGYPRLTAGGNAYNYFPGSSYSNSALLHNGNYFRLKNVNVEYNLPYNLLKKFKLSGIKIFANAQNLYTWSAYDVVDPEVSLPNYPVQKVINFGVNIKI